MLPALITPFFADGSAIGAEGLIANVEPLIGAGVGGLLPGRERGRAGS